MKYLDIKNIKNYIDQFNIILDINDNIIGMIDNNNMVVGYAIYYINNIEKMALLKEYFISNEYNNSTYNYELKKALYNHALNNNCEFFNDKFNIIKLKKKYKNILLDLDDTIFDFKKSEREAFKEVMKKLDVIIEDEDSKIFSEINEKYFQIFASGKLQRIEFQEMRFKKFFEYKNVVKDYSNANKLFLKILGSKSDLFDDSLEFLNKLSKKYNLFVASNGMESVQIERLKSSNIIKYFKKIYVSSKIGYNKPKIEFFNYIFNDLNEYNMDNYIIIGDREESDMQGGINANIDTIYVNRNKKISNNIYTYEVNDLFEILEILYI